jgi:hypothetical protein
MVACLVHVSQHEFRSLSSLTLLAMTKIRLATTTTAAAAATKIETNSSSSNNNDNSNNKTIGDSAEEGKSMISLTTKVTTPGWIQRESLLENYGNPCLIGTVKQYCASRQAKPASWLRTHHTKHCNLWQAMCAIPLTH